ACHTTASGAFPVQTALMTSWASASSWPNSGQCCTCSEASPVCRAPKQRLGGAWRSFWSKSIIHLAPPWLPSDQWLNRPAPPFSEPNACPFRFLSRIHVHPTRFHQAPLSIDLHAHLCIRWSTEIPDDDPVFAGRRPADLIHFRPPSLGIIVQQVAAIFGI